MSGAKTGGVANSTDILIVVTFVQLLLLVLSPHFLSSQLHACCLVYFFGHKAVKVKHVHQSLHYLEMD